MKEKDKPFRIQNNVKNHTLDKNTRLVSDTKCLPFDLNILLPYVVCMQGVNALVKHRIFCDFTGPIWS